MMITEEKQNREKKNILQNVRTLWFYVKPSTDRDVDFLRFKYTPTKINFILIVRILILHTEIKNQIVYM